MGAYGSRGSLGGILNSIPRGGGLSVTLVQSTSVALLPSALYNCFCRFSIQQQYVPGNINAAWIDACGRKKNIFYFYHPRHTHRMSRSHLQLLLSRHYHTPSSPTLVHWLSSQLLGKTQRSLTAVVAKSSPRAFRALCSCCCC